MDAYGQIQKITFQRTKYHTLGDLNNRNLLSHRSGGWMSKIMVWVVLVSSEGCEERVCPRPPLFGL